MSTRYDSTIYQQFQLVFFPTYETCLQLTKTNPPSTFLQTQKTLFAFWEALVNGRVSGLKSSLETTTSGVFWWRQLRDPSNYPRLTGLGGNFKHKHSGSRRVIQYSRQALESLFFLACLLPLFSPSPGNALLLLPSALVHLSWHLLSCRDRKLTEEKRRTSDCAWESFVNIGCRWDESALSVLTVLVVVS